MTDDTDTRLEEAERENARLRDQLKELQHLEEDLMAKRAFEKAKKYLFSWLTFSGILLTVVALFGVNSILDLMRSKTEETLDKITKEELGELIREASREFVTAHIASQEEDFNVLLNKQIRQVVVSLQSSSGTKTGDAVTTTEIAVTEEQSVVIAPDGDPTEDESPERQPDVQRFEMAAAPSDSSLEELADRFYDLPELAKEAARQGDFDVAERHAEDLLALAEQFPNDWNYGNAIHDGHMVLGMVALAGNDVESAESHLIEAGKTPGSPQLDSFGPSMMLAEALLEKNQTEAVLDYFELCRLFWELDDGRLDLWAAKVKRNETPDFRANLRY